jgi:hypothetical protein
MHTILFHRCTHATIASSYIVAHACDCHGSLHCGVRSPRPSPAWHLRPVLLLLLLPPAPSTHTPAPPSLLLHLHCAAPRVPPRCTYRCSAARPTAPDLPTPLNDADSRCQRKEKHRALMWKSSGLASCYDCGAPMQTVEDAAPKYDACCKSTFQMLYMFKGYVAYVTSIYPPIFHLFIYIYIYYKCVYLNVAYVSHMCCKYFIWILLLTIVNYYYKPSTKHK